MYVFWRQTDRGTNRWTELTRINYINGRHIKRVVSFKLLGVVISSDLTWDAHVSYILSKSSKRIYCILNLCKACVPTRDIVMGAR